MFSIKTFRFVALAEATSFVLLLIAMVFKYGADAPEGVSVMGMIHGLLFIAYVVVAVTVARPAKWSAQQTLLVLVGAVVPLGGFVVDRWLQRTGQLEAA